MFLLYVGSGMLYDGSDTGITYLIDILCIKKR